MKDDTSVIPLRQPEAIGDLLTENAVFVEPSPKSDLPDRRQRIVRHGCGPECEIQTGIGPLVVRQRTIRSRGCLSNNTALPIALKLVEAAEKLRPPRGGEPVAEGRARCQDQRRRGGGNTYRTSAEAAA